MAGARSTFSFINTTRSYLTQDEIIKLRSQWETFERIENYNSIVYSSIVGKPISPVGDTVIESVFYKFSGDVELQDYKQGRLNHIAEYPSVSDFVVPYSQRPLNSVSDIIGNADIFPGVIIDPRIDKSKVLTNDERLANINALNLFVKVSTQTSLYPKTPYKFSSNQEYLLYKNYLQTKC